jgi:hypothetical protein
MPQPFRATALGWRRTKRGDLVANNADSASGTSCRIAAEVLGLLSVTRRTSSTGQEAGAQLERDVESYLVGALPARSQGQGAWEVGRKRKITEFAQYEHLARMTKAIATSKQPDVLRSEIGGKDDYIIKPDITVGIVYGDSPGHPILHASISCKWTIRSDRVQNIRHEGVILARHRRGRLPHVVVATAEPMATRLAAIARGTGEIDWVYHIALDELVEATTAAGTRQQQDVLQELIGERRLFGLQALVDVLVV